MYTNAFVIILTKSLFSSSFFVVSFFIRLLRIADYPSQYNNNRNPSQPKYVQTTYRPSTVTTQTQSTSTKNIVPPQTYISNSKPIYDQSPAHETYNPEYDEALVAQVIFLQLITIDNIFSSISFIYFFLSSCVLTA